MVHTQPPINFTALASVCQGMTSLDALARANAASEATSMVFGAGLTWSQIVEAAVANLNVPARPAPAEPFARPSRASKAAPKPSAARTATRGGHDIKWWRQRIMAGRGRVTEWEGQFLASVVAQAGGLTPKQWSVVTSIAVRAGVVRAGEDQTRLGVGNTSMAVCTGKPAFNAVGGVFGGVDFSGDQEIL
jgi:hypothetical protein